MHEESRIQALEAENRKLQMRINLTNLRLKQIEHYLGMRDHSATIPHGERRWQFGQVRDDVQQNRKVRERAA